MAQTERTGGLEKLWTCLRVAASAKAGRNLWKLNHCAVSLLNHISLLPWRVTLNLNERILKLWRSTRPFGTKVDGSNFFTGSGGEGGFREFFSLLDNIECSDHSDSG